MMKIKDYTIIVDVKKTFFVIDYGTKYAGMLVAGKFLRVF
jgi:hypothetical protein